MMNKMCNLDYWHGYSDDKIPDEFNNKGYKSGLLEEEMAFDAADIMRFGKDIFIRKSATANNLSADWLRRQFPDLRVHLFHCQNATTRHADAELIPMAPPSPGKEGLVMYHTLYPLLEEESKIFLDNDWRIIACPPPQTLACPPLGVGGSYLTSNLLSISEKCVVIEESEIELYHILDDLGFDVIGVPLRMLNEFGGGLHCTTWDVRRDDSCKDYFPNQDYEAECEIDYNKFTDNKTLNPNDHELRFKDGKTWQNSLLFKWN